jgi:hypothetical protein
MKFIKPYLKFTAINESSNKHEYILYTLCDETYGYLNIVAADLSDYSPDMGDDGPCSYGCDGYIISEDEDVMERRDEFIDELIEKDGRTEEEIAKAQNPDVDIEDEDDVSWEVEKYFEGEIEEWEYEVKSEWIDEHMSSDLWGSIYYVETSEKLETAPDSPILYLPDGGGNGDLMPSKKYFEEKYLIEDKDRIGIIEFIELSSGGSDEKIAQVFFELLLRKPTVVAKIFNVLPLRVKELLVVMAKEKGIDVKALGDISDIGLF